MYPENPAEYTPPTADQLAKSKSEKKQKEIGKRQKVMESRERLGAVRLVSILLTYSYEIFFFFLTFVNFQGGAEEPCVCNRVVSKVGRSRGAQEERVLWEVRKDL